MEKYDNKETKEFNIDVDSLLRDIVRSIPITALLALFIASLVTLGAVILYNPQYESDTTFIVSTKGSVSYVNTNISTTVSMAEVFPEIIKSASLKKVVEEELDGTLEGVSIEASALEETNLLDMKVIAGDPVTAYKVSRIIIENYGDISEYIYQNAVLDVLSPPVVAMSANNPLFVKNLLKKIFLAAFAALLLLAAVISYLKDTVKSESELESKVECDHLATVIKEVRHDADEDRAPIDKIKGAFSRVMASPDKDAVGNEYVKLIDDMNSSFGYVEGFKRIRSKIERFNREGDKKIIMVSSVLDGEGKTSVSANISIALAEKGYRVVLIDADLKNPSQYRIFNPDVEEGRGLGAILNGSLNEPEEIIFMNEEHGVYVISGREKYDYSAELLMSERMQMLLEGITDDADYIIIDTPSVSSASDAEIITRYADGVILVTAQDMSLVPDINDAVNILEGHNAEIMGCVYNMASLGWFGTISESKYGYGYGYGYGSDLGYGYGYGKKKHGYGYGYGYGFGKAKVIKEKSNDEAVETETEDRNVEVES